MADTDIRKHSSTSNIIRVRLRHATTDDGLAGLTSASTGLIISTITDAEATSVTYTVAGSTIETITTLATYAAPTATKCRFKLVDDTNHPGLYEIQLADARFAVVGAKKLYISISGATDLKDAEYMVDLVTYAPHAGFITASVDSGDTALIRQEDLLDSADFIEDIVVAIEGSDSIGSFPVW